MTPTGSANEIKTVRSPQLSEGDLVAIVSPASYPTADHVTHMVDELEEWGLRVVVGDHVLTGHGPLAGDDSQRLDDLNRAIRNPEVRAILASRGGMGSYRITDHIDTDALRADPKPMVGFSDITNLSIAWWAKAGVPSIHGCIGHHIGADDVRHMLMDSAAITVTADPTGLTAPIRVKGLATGPLVGGNLRELAGTIGAGLPQLNGAILFLEDLRHIGIGQIDRNLTQLIRSRTLDNVAGIALGLFDGFEDYIDRNWHLLDVLDDRLTTLGVPVLGGIKAGHGGTDANGNPEQRSLCIGAPATLNTETATLAMSPCTTL